MKQEDKKLLLKDICSRLPYGVMCDFAYNPGNPQKLLYVTPYDEKEQIHLDAKEYKFGNGSYGPSDFDIEEVKPYLRPMSSMTPDERKEYDKLIANCLYDAEAYFFDNYDRLYDLLLSHHFDFRGLIPMGLALEAPEGMYKTE